MKDFKERLIDDIESCKQLNLSMQKDISRFYGYIDEANTSISYNDLLINLYKDKLEEIRKLEKE